MDTNSEHALNSRLYDTERDLRAMQDLLVEGRSRTDDWHYPHVGDLMGSVFPLSCHVRLQEHICLWHDARGKLLAYAILGEDPAFDCQVLREHEWSGVEEEALAWAETRLAALREQDAKRWGDPLGAVARPGDARRIAFLERHGFRRGEHVEVSLLRSLGEPIAEPVPPAGCRVRAVAGTTDVPDRAAIERDVWLPWPVGKIADDDYARLMRLPGYHRELDVIACAPDGTIAAYVNNWIDPVNRIGVCGPVGTRAAYRRQGFARAALLESLRRQRARGMDRVCISTGEANSPALRLYESLGFAPVSASLDYAKVE
ncbi:MAG: hypothetical protein AVDCRST_MAG18-4318 [uncultured Thermomicrobiales bacterium]|uniref:N-acetyltransferase domain-containing protein n=1 Tax=uncultured Thermomicrobiales bacterium TaxID=1645740 RepID=A0A6J4VUB7_9BACT|nr:MAG: hypothetical protein AVDCRST_MAG18-4318 [uncultured Thermomicrobiales bacterium]